MAEKKMTNVFTKLAKARVNLQQKKLKKTGYNEYNKYYYFQLEDFLPSVNEIFDELGLISQFVIYGAKYNAETGVQIAEETAVLTIFDSENPESYITFTSPTAESGMKGASAIQGLGGKHTYMRRYLWLECMEIVENDSVDGLSNDKKEAPTPKTKKITEEQQTILNDLLSGNSEKLEAVLAYYQVKGLEDLTMQQASQAISRLRETGAKA